MKKEKLLELLDTLRGIAEESKVASFEQWHEDGWVNCKFRYRYETQPPQPDPYAELKAAHAAGKMIQYTDDNNYSGHWIDCPCPFWVVPDAAHENARYRVKPEPQKMPLSQDDVKAGDEFLSPDGIRMQWWSIFTDVIVTVTGNWTYFRLMEKGWKIRSIGETEWRPCYKLVEQ